jgi:hypothetical protein
MKVLELRGLKSLRALNVFHTLMLGLKMLPQYAGESYEEFLSKINAMPDIDQEKMIREAVLFVELDESEVNAALSFATDRNGIPLGPENIKNLGPSEIMDAVVEVCKKVAAIRVDLVTDSEKKKSHDSQLIQG